ncbi:DUF6599 family protein [Parabacteroides gordonii]|jgi:hypothetical protein|uniref:DUF6599 family protein n=1 Tax=Parabacteroides gordonii TaxID=574930 RepID=UPI000EEFDB0C|nr:DUF6599 family protein [Parabacteroides gordonii]RGP16023.1 hypothetical protein DXB27_13525 [Parabacteroides gordonii]
MKHITQWLAFLLLVPALLTAQEVEVKRERTFTGSGLYGFMNGGAEQFLEYGVSRLVARDVVYEGQEYTIEIYDMPTPEDAFGIYSLHVFRCQRADTLACIDCLSPYQLQAVAGNKYVSVVFPSGSAVARNRVDELIRHYLPMDGNDNPQIPELLAAFSPYSGKLKFLRGPIGISGVSTSLMHYLEGISYTGVWFIADKPSKSYRALVCLREKDDAEALMKKIPAADIIQSADDFVYLIGKEKEAEEDDHGGFGF